MKIGDQVQELDELKLYKTHKICVVVDLKSDSRGIWVKFDNDMDTDVWHAAQYYEVINKNESK